MNALNAVDTLSLSTTSDEYRTLRSLLAEANSATRAWMQEPEEEAATRLFDVMSKAWLDCHEWALTCLDQGGWSPEILGWMALTGLYSEAPWQALSLSFQLLEALLIAAPDKLSDSEQDDYSGALKRLGSIILDESGQPPILAPLSEAALINGMTLPEVSSMNLDELTPDLNWVKSNLAELNKLTAILEKLPDFFKVFNQPAHLKKFKVKLDSCIQVLKHYAPEEVEGSEENSLEANESTNSSTVEQTAESDSKGSVSETKIANGGNALTMDRENARAQLQDLVTYFRMTEPHSPVSWQLEKALDWIDLSFPELLFRMTGERQELHNEICRRVGLAELSDLMNSISNTSTGQATASVYSSSHNESSSNQEAVLQQPEVESEANSAESNNDMVTNSNEISGNTLNQDLI